MLPDGLMPCGNCGGEDLAYSSAKMPVNCKKCGAWAPTVEAWNLHDYPDTPHPKAP